MDGRKTRENRDLNQLGVVVLYTNARSIVNKMDELRAIVTIKNPDIVAITETWTNDIVNDEHLQLRGYEIIERKDRNDTERGRGGGILIYAKQKLNVWRGETISEFNQKVKQSSQPFFRNITAFLATFSS